MQLWKLGTAIGLALASAPALATVSLNPAGSGEGLLYPFFTTYHGQSTLLTLANDTDTGKALKVRVMESWGGRETLTFNLYLGPNATWKSLLSFDEGVDPLRAFMVQGFDGLCVVPNSLMDAPQPLLTHGYAGDEGPQGGERTREGYVEVVEMGVLDAELSALAAAASDASCAALQARHATDGIWRTSPNAGLAAPRGGLQGEAMILNTAEGTAYTYAALAFEGLSVGARQRVLADDTLGPRLVDIETVQLPNASQEPISVELVDSKRERHVLRYPAGQGHNAISALLASDGVHSEFTAFNALAARTEWVVSFPTRRAHEMSDTTVPPAASVQRRSAPFTSASRCEEVTLALHDTRGNAIDHFDIPSSVPLCGAVDVLRFESGTFETGPVFAREDDAVQPGDTAGRAELDFATLGDGLRHSAPDLDGRCWIGLPAWVMSVSAYENHNARAGLMANYSTTNSVARAVEVVDCDTID